MQLDKLAKMISKVGSVVSVAAFFIFLIHDILTNRYGAARIISIWQKSC